MTQRGGHRRTDGTEPRHVHQEPTSDDGRSFLGRKNGIFVSRNPLDHHGAVKNSYFWGLYILYNILYDMEKNGITMYNPL